MLTNPNYPQFQRHDTVRLSATSGVTYFAQVHAHRVVDFMGAIMTLGFNPAVLRLEQIAIEASGARDTAGAVLASNAQIVSSASGQVRFRCVRQIRAGSDWSGLVVAIRFSALRAGTTDITLS